MLCLRHDRIKALRLISLILALSITLSFTTPFSTSRAKGRRERALRPHSREQLNAAPSETQTAPGSNLPNLDELRNLTPTAPQAPPAIPSTTSEITAQASTAQAVTSVTAETSEPPPPVPLLLVAPAVPEPTPTPVPPPPPVPLPTTTRSSVVASSELLASLFPSSVPAEASIIRGVSDSPASPWNAHARSRSVFPALVPQGMTETVWFDDQLPTGATTAGNYEGWNWISSNPVPYSGTAAHQSNIVSGLHNHYFYSATQTMTVDVGETLFTYVYLDPANMPSEIMVQWNDGGSDWYNAYWGADNVIPSGPRHYMGALPSAGQWVRLEIPASTVGVEGKTISGMAFTAYDGRMTWDRAGRLTQTPSTGNDTVWFDDSVPTGGVQTGNYEGWSWVTSNPAPYSGTSAHQSNIVSGLHNHYFYSATQTLTVGTGDKLFTYVYIDPANMPAEIMVQWNDGVTWYDAYWGANNIVPTGEVHYMGALPNAGQWVRLEVPASTLGLEGKTLSGMAFTMWNGRATWDRAGKTGPPPPTADNFSEARLDPVNRTGIAGEDLLSRNFNWGVPLLSLRGRSGLDLGLSLTYNSLVWTKYGTFIKFDADHGFPSPGFRLGFPAIEPKFHNSQTDKDAYLLITPSGSHVELRQTQTNHVYESADSSYLQLTENDSTLILRTTDGTQLSFHLYSGEYQCAEIKDRNGNYISISHDEGGRITTLTDTLARVITFNYDTNGNLISITQPWTRETQTGTVTEIHQWATFGWDNLTINTSFSGLTLLGVQNGQTIPVLTQVGFPDGSRYNFEYTSWGQVKKISNYAANNSLLNYVSYDMETGTGQTSCPRFTERYDYAKDWNNEAEVGTSFGPWVANAAWAQVTMPDGTFYKEYFGTTGWQRGLTTKTEAGPANSTPKKTVNTTWTQDDEALAYQLNPRVKETTISDSDGNNKRTRMSYTSYGLPNDIYEYQSDAVRVLRRTHIEYCIDSTQDAAYLNRRIIGLVKAQMVYDGNGDDSDGNDILSSKVEYGYDEADETGLQLLVSAGTPTQHDTPNYGPTFRQGRGLVTSIKRVSVDNPSDTSLTRVSYNTTGSVYFTRDPLGHQVTISYLDSFSDGVNHNTVAYPTGVTDADGYVATTKYNYDMGVQASVSSPSSGSISAPPITYLEQKMLYDEAGRIKQATNQANGAYTKWVYLPQQVLQYRTIQEDAGEAFSFTISDGAGRPRATGGNLPPTPDRYSAQFFISDVMGRVIQQARPTEITGTWVPAGEDAAGWVWSYQSYDWKGRPLTTTNADGTTVEASYGGCGCAGGQVVVTRDEVGRRRKVTYDILGRVHKTETLFEQAKNVPLDGSGDVYAATLNTYSVLDQVTNVRQYAGPEGSGTYQDTVMTYDGYGRLKTRHLPAQDAGKVTTYTYDADGRVQTVKDAREVVSTFGYNARHQMTSVTYNAPAGITPTPSVSYAYDAAGNRTSMNDGLGSISYVYNSLARMTSETRYFSALGQSFTLSYNYNLAGELTSLTDQTFGTTTSYTYDQLGRLTGVGGTGYGSIPNFISGIQYRAWGVVKAMSYGNGRSLTVNYNSRGLPSSYTIPGVMSKTYQYYNDGMLSYSHDGLDSRYDRKNSYDQLGRISLAVTGTEANGGNLKDGPYHEEYQYDALSNMTNRTSWHWTADYYDSTTYANNKRAGWNYDAEGNMINDGTTYNPLQYSYDAAERMVKITDPAYTIPKRTDDYDGDGERLKSGYRSGCSPGYECPLYYTYYLRSTVLGGRIVSEFESGTQKLTGYIYHPSGTIIALQKMATSSSTTTVVIWEHWDAAGMSERMTDAAGNTNYFPGSQYNAELDPVGADTGLENPYPLEQTGDSLPDEYSPQPLVNGDPSNLSNGCRIDGMPISCSDLSNRMELGFVAEESTLHGKDGFIFPKLPIVPFGAGLFGRIVPESATKFEGNIVVNGDLRTFNFSHAQPGPDLNTIINAAQGCFDEIFKGFEVKLNSLKPASQGGDGKASVSWTIPGNQPQEDFTITTITSKNGIEVAAIAHNGEPWVAGYTYGLDPFRNYVASDINDPKPPPKMINGKLRYPKGIYIAPDTKKIMDILGGDRFLAGQLHELANSLSALIDINTHNPAFFGTDDPDDQDTGYRLDKCLGEKLGGKKK